MDTLFCGAVLSHFRPPNPFSPSWHMLPKKTINLQPAHQLQAKPRPSKIPYLFNPHPLYIDIYPFRFDILVQATLDAYTPFGSILHTQAAGLVHFTKPGHNSLAWSSFGPIGLHQCPVMVPFAIFCACHFSYIHAEIIDNQQSKSTG